VQGVSLPAVPAVSSPPIVETPSPEQPSLQVMDVEEK